MDVGEIYNLVKKTTDLATVYRSLEVFCNKGFVVKLEFGEGKYRYEIRKNDHHHLICEKCNKIGIVEDKFMQNWEEEIKKTKKFLVKRHALEFFGLCNNCQN